ncbi:MAG: ADP-glyceromanno-heptose 6-epimerase [Flavobacteriales bacterium]
MIVVTGAAGFIASVVASRFLQDKDYQLVLVDDFSRLDKVRNYENFKNTTQVDRSEFTDWLDLNYSNVEFIIHLGARTDTTEQSVELFDRLNLNYTKQIWKQCIQYNLPLIYASSAATYGDGTLGFDDNESTMPNLTPLNPYGDSKQDFDVWALNQNEKPKFWAGLKFFNVYGPNEYHKGRMASVVFHTFNQVNKTDKMKLFRSHKEEYNNGEQLRDFIYVKDVADVILFLMKNSKKENSGIYNLGTGKARSFLSLAKATFKAMGKPENIEYIDIPEDIRDTYQYFTEAKMEKLVNIGYIQPFTSLEDGVTDYVQNYLEKNRIY